MVSVPPVRTPYLWSYRCGIHPNHDPEGDEDAEMVQSLAKRDQRAMLLTEVRAGSGLGSGVGDCAYRGALRLTVRVSGG